MTRVLWSAVIGSAAIVMWVVALPGQTKPDFSGEWSIEADPAVGQPAAGRGGRGGTGRRGGGRGPQVGDMGSGWGSTVTLEQESQALTLEYVFFSRGDLQPPLRFHYALDGSETTNAVMMGQGVQTETATTAWDGETLVITTRHTFTHPGTGDPVVSVVTRRLSLESADLMVVEVRRDGVLGGEPSTTRTTYRKSS